VSLSFLVVGIFPAFGSEADVSDKQDAYSCFWRHGHSEPSPSACGMRYFNRQV